MVSQLLAHFELEAQRCRGAVVDENGVLVEAVEHADFEVNRLPLHPHRNINRVARHTDRDLNTKQEAHEVVISKIHISEELYKRFVANQFIRNGQRFSVIRTKQQIDMIDFRCWLSREVTSSISKLKDYPVHTCNLWRHPALFNFFRCFNDIQKMYFHSRF